MENREEIIAINVSAHEQHFPVWRQEKCSHDQDLRHDTMSERLIAKKKNTRCETPAHKAT